MFEQWISSIMTLQWFFIQRGGNEDDWGREGKGIAQKLSNEGFLGFFLCFWNIIIQIFTDTFRKFPCPLNYWEIACYWGFFFYYYYYFRKQVYIAGNCLKISCGKCISKIFIVTIYACVRRSKPECIEPCYI